MAYSVLQGVQSPNAGQGLLDAISSGQNIRAQGQQSQIRQQDISENDYQSAVRKIQIANKLAKKALTLPPEGRAQLMRDYSGALQSVGFTPEDLAGTPMDDAGLQNLVAQTDSVLSSVMPQSQSNQQFGAQETLKDEKGNLFFATSKRDPTTGEVVGVVAAADGSNARPVGKLSSTGAYGQTAQERITQVGNEAGARTGGELDARLEIEPELQKKIQEAKTFAKLEAEKRFAQTGQSNKLNDADRIYKNLSGGDLDIIYGKGEQWYPELLRSQKGIDMIAQKDQLVGMLNLAARGELKGQGSITESEGATVLKAATTLSNPNISPEMAKEALGAAMNIIYKNAGQQFQDKPQTINWNDLP